MQRASMQGVTLIELAVTLAILAFLMLVGVPLTASWIHSVQVYRSHSLLQEGLGQVKALALRNPEGIQADSTDPDPEVAGLKLLENRTLLVCKGATDDSGCIDEGGKVVWQTDLSRGVGVDIAFTQGGHAVDRLGFNNAGMPLAQVHYAISKGAENEEGLLR